MCTFRCRTHSISINMVHNLLWVCYTLLGDEETHNRSEIGTRDGLPEVNGYRWLTIPIFVHPYTALKSACAGLIMCYTCFRLTSKTWPEALCGSFISFSGMHDLYQCVSM